MKERRRKKKKRGGKKTQRNYRPYYLKPFNTSKITSHFPENTTGRMEEEESDKC